MYHPGFCCFCQDWTNCSKSIFEAYRTSPGLNPVSSTIQIFTKLLSFIFNFIPKAWIKQKKFLAVSLSESISSFGNYLHAPRLNFVLQRLILSSDMFICSAPSNILSTIGLSSWIMKCFKPSRPNESKKKCLFSVRCQVYSTNEHQVCC